MTTIDEIAPDLFRLCVYVPEFDMQFNHFLVRDEEPLNYVSSRISNCRKDLSLVNKY